MVSEQERLRSAPPACSLPTGNRRPGWKQGVRSPTEGHFSGLPPALEPLSPRLSQVPWLSPQHLWICPSLQPDPPNPPRNGPHVSPIALST